ncbi:hypothetical protein FQR65_LT17994 [Abscondita terminalis]|nr:hypothetical protein FQR65_LT17994 [Abscondita terminalis]
MRDITEEALEQLRKGVELKDGITLPAQAAKVEQPEWLWDRDPPMGLQPGETKEIEPLLYPDFQNVPARRTYRFASYVQKTRRYWRKTDGTWMTAKNRVAKPMELHVQIPKLRVVVDVDVMVVKI